MSDQVLTQEQQEQAVKAVYELAAQKMKAKESDESIIASLKQSGLEEDAARTVVTNLRNAVAEQKHKAGTKNMIYGALWCVGGIIVTAVTFSIASDRGGTYVVAWGAIAFGAIQFFRGLIQKLSR